MTFATENIERTAGPNRWIRNPFELPGNVFVGEREDEVWAKTKAKLRVEHDRMRRAWLDMGAELGPIAYVEWASEKSGRLCGEWRSEILKESLAAV